MVICEFGCLNCFFLNATNLICRSTDISKCFKGSLRFRDNESQLYAVTPHLNRLDCLTDSSGE